MYAGRKGRGEGDEYAICGCIVSYLSAALVCSVLNYVYYSARLASAMLSKWWYSDRQRVLARLMHRHKPPLRRVWARKGMPLSFLCVAHKFSSSSFFLQPKTGPGRPPSFYQAKPHRPVYIFMKDHIRTQF